MCDVAAAARCHCRTELVPWIHTARRMSGLIICRGAQVCAQSFGMETEHVPERTTDSGT